MLISGGVESPSLSLAHSYLALLLESCSSLTFQLRARVLSQEGHHSESPSLTPCSKLGSFVVHPQHCPFVQYLVPLLKGPGSRPHQGKGLTASHNAKDQHLPKPLMGQAQLHHFQ